MASQTRATLFAVLFLFVGLAKAFAPMGAIPSSKTSMTSLQFGFLKELGLEKPSWLPDFGSKDGEEDAPAPAATESEESEAESEGESEE